MPSEQPYVEYRSAVYTGQVRHRRMSPKQNSFTYQVYMMYLDLDEIDKVLSLSPLWSKNSWALARFKRSDFHGSPERPLKDCVLDTAEAELGWRPEGPVRMLANLRYWGYNMNPITTYYCFDATGKNVCAVVAEVNNTPWNQRHAYVIDYQGDATCHTEFDKQFHVSPFNPMDMQYRWRSNTPDKVLSLHLENWQNEEKVMDATLTLKRRSLSRFLLNYLIIRYPYMTVKVIVSIYWQALKLWYKRVPYVPPPKANRHDTGKAPQSEKAMENNKNTKHKKSDLPLESHT